MSELYRKKVGLLIPSTDLEFLFGKSFDFIFDEIQEKIPDLREEFKTRALLRNVVEASEDFYDMQKSKIGNSFLLPVMDFNGHSSMQPLELLDCVQGSLLISTPSQYYNSLSHVENPYDLLELDGVSPSVNKKTLTYGFNSSGYFYCVNEYVAKRLGFEYDKSQTFPPKSVSNLLLHQLKENPEKFGLERFEKNLSFSSFAEKCSLKYMPSIFYYEFFKFFGVLNEDISPSRFYQNSETVMVSGYF